MSSRATVFDLDGTLVTLPVDIEPVRAAIGRRLAQVGWTGPMAPLLEVIEQAAQRLNDPARGAALRRAAMAEIEQAEVRAAEQARALPGAHKALYSAAAQGPTGLVTDNGLACIEPALAAASLSGHRFDAMVTRDHVQRGKPDPAGLIKVARELLPDGGQLVWIGDSPRDVLAGRAAREALPEHQIEIVAVLGGRGQAADIERARPDRMVTGLEAVRQP